MTTWLIAGGILGFPVLVATILSQAELWQRKEYRWDRMRAYLREPYWRRHVAPWLIPAGGCVVGALVSHRSSLFAPYAPAIGLLSLLFLSIYHGKRSWQHGIYRPTPTLKALVLTGAFTAWAGCTYLLIARTGLSTPVHLALTVWVTLLATPAITLLVNFPFYIKKKHIIRTAYALRTAQPTLTVVGITGSYGKTSTKHFLQQLLANQSNVAATAEHRNSALAVAQDMLVQLPQKPQLYIAEMGAYRPGEIKELSQLTQPRIGVITAIGNQHLELFGSQEKVTTAKWELIDSLPPDGIAVLNQDNTRLRSQAATYSRPIVWYSRSAPATVYIDEYTVAPHAITGTLHIGDWHRPVTIPLASDGLLSSVLAAVACAHALKLPPDTIAAQLATLKPFPRTMEIKPGPGGATIIDDSYSASEHGVINAIEHLNRFPHPDKQILLTPIIELGPTEAKAAHTRIGRALKNTPATVYLTSSDYLADLKTGSGGTVRFEVLDIRGSRLTEIIDAFSPDTALLVEGRLPATVHRQLTEPNSV